MESKVDLFFLLYEDLRFGFLKLRGTLVLSSLLICAEAQVGENAADHHHGDHNGDNCQFSNVRGHLSDLQIHAVRINTHLVMHVSSQIADLFLDICENIVNVCLAAGGVALACESPNFAGHVVLEDVRNSPVYHLRPCIFHGSLIKPRLLYPLEFPRDSEDGLLA